VCNLRTIYTSAGRWACSVVVSEEATHVDIGGFLFLLLFLLGCGGGGNGGTNGGGNGGGADVGDKLLNILALEGLGEEVGPVGLNFVAGCLDDFSELIAL